ncbi:hypothetical protein BC828DRAFT_12408 [Blastocladiella britannica]|nr:hypothetical protein BC828DRAFT_12408 [Blastocladiella britannica]
MSPSTSTVVVVQCKQVSLIFFQKSKPSENKLRVRVPTDNQLPLGLGLPRRTLGLGSSRSVKNGRGSSGPEPRHEPRRPHKECELARAVPLGQAQHVDIVARDAVQERRPARSARHAQFADRSQRRLGIRHGHGRDQDVARQRVVVDAREVVNVHAGPIRQRHGRRQAVRVGQRANRTQLLTIVAQRVRFGRWQLLVKLLHRVVFGVRPRAGQEQVQGQVADRRRQPRVVRVGAHKDGQVRPRHHRRNRKIPVDGAAVRVHFVLPSFSFIHVRAVRGHYKSRKSTRIAEYPSRTRCPGCARRFQKTFRGGTGPSCAAWSACPAQTALGYPRRTCRCAPNTRATCACCWPTSTGRRPPQTRGCFRKTRWCARA